MRRAAKYIIVGFCVLVLGHAVCWLVPSGVERKGLIVRPGTYTSPSRKYQVKVSDAKGIVYTMRNVKLGTSKTVREQSSPYQRWFFCWDSQDGLWYWASDDGRFVCWEPQESGEWRERTPVDFHVEPFRYDDDILRRLPEAAFDYLPSSAKDRQIAAIRDGGGHYQGARAPDAVPGQK